MRLRDISGRLAKLERGGGANEGIAIMPNGARRVVRCKDVLGLCIASMNRIYFGPDVPLEYEATAKRFGPILDTLERAERFESGDNFFAIVAEQIISSKGALPLCQTKPEI